MFTYVYIIVCCTVFKHEILVGENPKHYQFTCTVSFQAGTISYLAFST